MSVYRKLNALGLIVISGMLCFALLDQFMAHELPCPLCLLQRVGFVAVGIGFLLNVMRGPRPAHYSFSMLAALVGGAVALRQVSLHVIPGTPPYGAPFLGYHFYTWAFIWFAVALTVLAVITSFARQYVNDDGFLPLKRQPWLGKIAVIMFLIIIAVNVLSTFALCGPGVCPDNPLSYWIFG